MADDIVITGLGVASPIGIGEAAFWKSLRTGQSGASPVTNLDTSELTRHVACRVTDPFDPHPAMGRASALAVHAAASALSDAKLADGVDARLATTVGTTMGETDFIEERLFEEDANWLTTEHARRIAAGQPGCIARNVHRALGLRGSAVDLYGACAAGNLALTNSLHALRDGRCDVALAGGADGFSRLAFIGFMRLRVMAAERCRPFDQERDGLLVGEGAAMFVLERESSARARGARIRARIAAGSITCEKYHPTRPDPNGDGLTRANQAALAEAGLTPTDIQYVCAHGTGTPQNDAIEVKVLQQCYPQGVAFSSIKALTGHPMGAAAAIEAAACVLTLENQTLIPTWHLHTLLDGCDLDAVRDAPRETAVRCVVNNSAGFGGYNSSLILAAA